MRRLLCIALFLFSTQAWAFPEMVRHNYVNCTSCHVSPTGGGVLSKYGRELSRTLLTTWGVENKDESKFAYGLLPLWSGIDAMGMFRGVYAYQKTPYIEQSLYIFMQNDLELAWHAGNAHFVGTIGYQNPATAQTIGDRLISRRHYFYYQNENGVSFRLGRFFPAFGINTPDHIIATKRNLGWDEGAESYNLELASLGEIWSTFVTFDLGRIDNPSLQRELGFALTQGVAIADHHKLGVSYRYGFAPGGARNIAGIWGILGFTPRLFLLTEWDAVSLTSELRNFPARFGAVNYQKFDYEFIQGMHLYLTQEFSQLAFADSNTLSTTYGVGTQLFPRPHFEINFTWKKMRKLSVSDQLTDFAYLMFQFYL